MDNYVTILGFVAGTITTVAFIPQVLKSWRTRQTKGLSLFMLLFLITGIILWTIYGFILKALPVILANGITLILILVLLFLKLKYK
ncbi:MAG: SemiSWEET transporter [Planctomycetota bacterium]